MKKGISLHIGLNSVNLNHYSGWNGKLSAAENDANDMLLIATSKGISGTKLLGAEATRNAVITAISSSALKLKENDLFFITYSGHGGQLPDQNSDEDDGMDETWCLYDGQLVDDELSTLWSTFQKGVRILVISDSCHSGTMTRAIRSSENPRSTLTPKFMPDEIVSTTYFSNKEFYDNILEKVKINKIKNINASVKLISGCQDNQSSYDGIFNGQFTGMLKKVWNGGKFSSNYLAFYRKIMNSMPPEQTPNYYNIGLLNQAFDDQNPFTV